MIHCETRSLSFNKGVYLAREAASESQSEKPEKPWSRETKRAKEMIRGEIAALNEGIENPSDWEYRKVTAGRLEYFDAQLNKDYLYSGDFFYVNQKKVTTISGVELVELNRWKGESASPKLYVAKKDVNPKSSKVWS